MKLKRLFAALALATVGALASAIGIEKSAEKAVEEVKAGRVEYRTDSFGIIHGIIGKVSFSEEDLLANLDAFVNQIIRIKPATVKGDYIKSISISSTMGPGIKIENNFDK